MDILEELKQQTESRQVESDDSGLIPGSVLSYQHSILISSLKKIHDYLHELTGHLNQLDAETTVEIQIPEYGPISNLKQHDYQLVWENRARQNHIHLSFCTRIKDACRIELDADDSANMEKIIKNAGLSYKLTEHDLILSGNIGSSVSFCINLDDNNIILTLVNFNRLGKQRYAIDKKLIDDNFFDQFGRFLLHRENNFIDIVSSHSIEHGGFTDADDDENESGVHTQEMDISRVRSLFSKEVQLYLTYHNTIKEMHPNSDEFILGRSRQCGIIVNSDLASRQHARIVYRKGKYVLIDQSTNGTFIKTQGGKEVYVQGEEFPLSGSGFISLGKSVTVDNEHIIYFSCQ